MGISGDDAARIRRFSPWRSARSGQAPPRRRMPISMPRARRCSAAAPPAKIGPGPDNEVGLSLNGLIGRTAGTEAGFTYSDAMKQAGEGRLVWSNDTLFAYLENPKAMVPGTKMAFAGLKSEDDRYAVIAWYRRPWRRGITGPAALTSVDSVDRFRIAAISKT